MAFFCQPPVLDFVTPVWQPSPRLDFNNSDNQQVAAKDPALFMALLYNSYAHLDAMRSQPVSSQAMAIKAEAIRHINAKLADPLKAASGETIAGN
jgi:hypothetical protein